MKRTSEAPGTARRRRPRTTAGTTRAVLLAALLALVLTAAACGSSEQATSLGTVSDDARYAELAEASDPAEEARAEAGELAEGGDFAAAARALAGADLEKEANRMQRRGARVLLGDARSALKKGKLKTAKRLATESRRLRKTAAARTVLANANAGIARAEAAARERRRLARVARDARTCSSAEKRTVRDGAGTPAGCAGFAAELLAEQAAEAEEQTGGGDCDPNYSGACLKPDSPDYDCAGGSGDGPDYTGPVQVVGDDPHGLDRDGDGFACESS